MAGEQCPLQHAHTHTPDVSLMDPSRDAACVSPSVDPPTNFIVCLTCLLSLVLFAHGNDVLSLSGHLLCTTHTTAKDCFYQALQEALLSYSPALLYIKASAVSSGIFNTSITRTQTDTYEYRSGTQKPKAAATSLCIVWDSAESDSSTSSPQRLL